jgi:hypothetical protein
LLSSHILDFRAAQLQEIFQESVANPILVVNRVPLKTTHEAAQIKRRKDIANKAGKRYNRKKKSW